MAILGACIAATLFVLGWVVLGSIELILEGDTLSVELFAGMLGFFLVAFAFGIVIALLTAFPLGWLYGRLILESAPPSIGTAALTGSLTGATLTAIVSTLGGDGFDEMSQLLSLFTLLGAISGAMAFYLVKRHHRHDISS